ncbi:MAG TPA: metal ABC transporter permease [Tepidisphaeraceae bacterium]|nr:metal ABC transporter permease [Tepidisphaeraceae bacterium]
MLATVSFQTALITAAAMGTACAVLSVIVVLRRWAFIGEGIAHAGFGGAGTAWILSLLLPSSAFLVSQEGIYLVAIVFCLCMAMGIGWVTRREQVRTDTAIGIFLVAALAWGFIAYGIYTQASAGRTPPGWDDYLLGHMSLLPASFMAGAITLCVVVLAVVFLLGKEIVHYCFDPELAAVSGIPVGFIHYLLIVLLAITIVLGMRLMGSLLVTALLVLPGASALLLSRRIGLVMVIAAFIGLFGAVVGTLISARWPFIPEGPAIVFSLIAQFGAAYVCKRARA